MNLIIYTEAQDKTASAVTSMTDTTPLTELEQLVLGDTPTISVTFTNGTAAPSWAGQSGYTMSLALGTPDGDGRLDYTQIQAETAISGGWSGNLPLDTPALVTALNLLVNQGATILRPPTQRYTYQAPRFAWFVLQIAVRGPDGYLTTYASLRVCVLNRVITSNFSEQQSADAEVFAWTEEQLALKANIANPVFTGGITTPQIATASGNLTLAPANVSVGYAGGFAVFPEAPTGDGASGAYAPLRWGSGAKYSLVGGRNLFEEDGGTSDPRTIPDLAGGLTYNAQATSGDVTFGWQFESRYAGTTELYYSWSGIQPAQIGTRRPIQLNTSWGPGYGGGGLYPADAPAGTTVASFHFDRLYLSGANPFSDIDGVSYLYAVGASTLQVNAATTLKSLSVEGSFALTNGLLNVTSGTADVALLKNSASSAAIRFGRDFSVARNSGNLQFVYVASGDASNRVGLSLYGSADSLTIYDTGTASTTTTTGAAVVTGGLGVSGAANFGGAVSSGGTLTGTGLTIAGTGTGSKTYSLLSAALGNGPNYATLVLGKANSGNDGAQFQWEQVGNASASNSLYIGIAGTGNAIRIQPDLSVRAIASTASTSTTTGALIVSGGAGIAGNVVSGGIVRVASYLAASLPTASTYPGGIAYVTDSTGTGRHNTVAGGGANKVMVYSDGTNWLIF